MCEWVITEIFVAKIESWYLFVSDLVCVEEVLACRILGGNPPGFVPK